MAGPVFNALVLFKEAERYIFIYGDDQAADAIRRLDKFASNPDLSFTWFDAAVLSQKIRQWRTLEKREAINRWRLPWLHE